MTQAAVLLAAGGGRRFAGEGPKLLTEFRGRPLVSWALEAAAGGGFDELVVVCGPVDLTGFVDPKVNVVHNDRWAEGQATSLQAGLAHCVTKGHEAAVVGLADQPLVPASAWRRVAEARQAPIVVATYGGARRNPVRLAREVWPLLPTIGDAGARVLMAQRPDLVGEVACEGDPADIDTVEDLRRWN